MSPSGQRAIPQTVLQYSLGNLLFFYSYSGKEPIRIFVVLISEIAVYLNKYLSYVKHCFQPIDATRIELAASAYRKKLNEVNRTRTETTEKWL